MDGDRIVFDDSVAANIAFADAFAARIRHAIDDGIVANGYDAPSPEFDGPLLPAAMRQPRVLDLRVDGIESVVWCTGYTGDFTWLDPRLTDGAGHPLRNGAAAAAPALWYMGLRWLTRRGSGNFIGFPADAAEVANAVATYLGGSTVRTRAVPEAELRLVREPWNRSAIR